MDGSRQNGSYDREEFEQVTNRRSYRHRGRTYQVQRQQRVGSKRYLVVRQLASSGRRLLAIDPALPSGGELRVIHTLPHSAGTLKRLRSISRLSDASGFPTIVDSAVQGEKILVVTTWTEGRTLRAYLNQITAGRRPPISPHQAVRLFHHFVHALCHLHHRRGVFHGDIKPENVILASHERRLVLIDYGSAWCIEQMHRRDAGDGLTQAYCAPEVLDGQPGHFRADQFSASVLFYELLTGRVPYDALGGKAGTATMAAQPTVPFVPPSRLAPQAGRTPRRFWKQIDAIAARGLSLQADGRYDPREWRSEVTRLWRRIDGEREQQGGSRVVLRLVDALADIVGRFRQQGDGGQTSSTQPH